MEKKFALVIVLIVSFLAIASLFHRGLHPTHDGEYHVVRFYEFSKVIRDGDLYPRWAPDLNYGFGVPLFNFNYPLPNYASSFLHIFGLSFIDAFKMNMAIATIFGSIFFFLWTRIFFGNIGGMISSVFYTFSPYHFLDIYIRGSVGEVWALAFFPAYLWAMTLYFKNHGGKYFILSAIFLAAIIFSHNILALMFLPFALSYMGFLLFKKSKLDKKLLFSLSAVFLLGISLSAIFWMPAIFERNYVVGLQINDYSPNFPQLYQLLFPSWGSGFSGGPLSEQLSFQIGIANLLAVFLAILVLFKKIDKEKKRIISFFLLWLALIFFLMLEVSIPVWKIVPFMDYFQFPWRFLSLEILIASFLAGSIVYLFKPRVIAAVAITLTIIFGIGYTKPAYYLDRTDSYYTSRSNFIDGTNSIGNAFNTTWANGINKRQEKLILAKGNGKISSKLIKSTVYKFTAKLYKDDRIIINTAFFPGWSAYIDGNKTPINIEENGSFSIKASKGDHGYEIRFEDTPIRRLANLISLFSILSILLYVLRFVRIKRNK